MKLEKIIITVTVLIVLSIIVSKSIIAITGTDNDVNITGQINVIPLNLVLGSLTAQGTGQTIIGLGSNDDTKSRFGNLESNNAPTISLISLANNTFTNKTLTEFLWELNDEENDTLSSSLEIYNNSNLSSSYYINQSISQQDYNISFNLTIPEDITLYWRIKTNDSEVNSSFIGLNIFTIDRTPPTEYNLSIPANNTESTDTTPELSWSSPTETNFQNYTIQFCETITCQNASIIGTSTTESFTAWSSSDVLEKQNYFWRVLATDKANNQQYSSVFKYTVIASQTEIQVQTTGGGGGESRGGAGTQLYTLSIISPPDITIHSNDTLTVPLIVTNPARILTLRDINLSISSDSEDVSPFLGETFIKRLRPKEQATVPLTIVTHTDPGTYGMTIIATVANPPFEDRVRILASLIEKNTAKKSSSTKQLGFAKDLLNGNPECLDLKEYITQAEQSIADGQTDQAINLIENAITSCQKLLNLKRPTAKQTIVEIPHFIEQNKTYFILAAETIGFLSLVLIIVRILKRKRIKK